MALFEGSCSESYNKVFSDGEDFDWCTLGYSGRKLTALKSGNGGFAECIETFDDGQVVYALIRMAKTDDGGDSKRVKFVFITWVGENAPALKKGQVTAHKSEVGNLFKGYHVEKQIFERSELDGLQAEIDKMLKTAGGANYDMGNINSGVKAGGSTGVKNASKSFFQQKDKETELGSFVYEKHTSNSKEVSACDLGGRTFTVSAADAKRNTVGYTPTKASAEVVSTPTKAAPVDSAPESAPAPVKTPEPVKVDAPVEEAAEAVASSPVVVQQMVEQAVTKAVEDITLEESQA